MKMADEFDRNINTGCPIEVLEGLLDAERRGWIRRYKDKDGVEQWTLTEAGIEVAKRAGPRKPLTAAPPASWSPRH
jgi:hypothetical protein